MGKESNRGSSGAGSPPEAWVGTAPGKVILLGEHAVVYGEPAIAVPVSQVRARATLTPLPAGRGLTLVAADLGRRYPLAQAPDDDPLALIVRLTLEHFRAREPDALLTVTSSIPIAGGLGSGAAVSAAIVRALAGFLGETVGPTVVSRLVYEVEKLHHGTPSGIDNTVIAYEMPVYFVRQPQGPPRIEPFTVARPFRLLIADSGIASPTREVVGDVRRAWEANRERYDLLFGAIGWMVEKARQAIAQGELAALGLLMGGNQQLLREMGVSHPRLEALIRAAKEAGALGVKLSGAGRGGNVIALVDEETEKKVASALAAAGAVRVIATTVRGNNEANGG